MRRLPLRIRRLFVKAQLGLASAILLDIIVSALARSAQSLTAVLVAWLALALLLLAAQLLMMISPVQRFSYYRIWIDTFLGQALRLAGGVQGLSRDLVHPVRPRLRWLLGWFDLPYENWIRESAHWEPSGATKVGFAVSPHPQGAPVFVQRDHLVGVYRWPGQSFASVVMFKPARITRSTVAGYQLSVDLTGEPYGIYKNRGKQFLDHLLRRLQQQVPRMEVLDRSARLHRFLMETTTEPGEIIAGGPHQPLRWSSAGALPLVHWRKPGQGAADDWFVLFFRGISPVGWNLASGSSESAREWRNLFEVGVRELCEELVVLEGPPVRQGKPVAEVFRRPFRPGQAANTYPDLVRRLTGRDFVREHNRLRETQDQITIIDDPSRAAALRLHEIETNSTIVITGDEGSYNTENVIFTVNPLEAGIEGIFLFRFNLADNDYLLFGEVLEDLGALAREPVLLLRRSFVENELAKHGSLGQLLPDQERKQLPAVPPSDYHIFDADTVLRERHLRALLNYLDIPAEGIRNAEHAARIRETITRHLANEKNAGRGRMLLEARFHANWFAEYGGQFSSLRPNDPLEAHTPDQESLLALCAVTWKTLELVCQHKIGA